MAKRFGITTKIIPTASTGDAILKSEGDGTYTEVANFKVDDNGALSGSLDVEYAITASTITNGAQYNGVVVLTPTVSGNFDNIDIDATLGPHYHTILTGNVNFNNPTNSIAGQEIRLGIHQNDTGSWSATFESDWNLIGQLDDISTSASSDSFITAVARDYGNGVVWDYEISHGERLDGYSDIQNELLTTGSQEQTIVIVPMSTEGTHGVGVIDASIIAFATASQDMAQWGTRMSFFRSGSVITNKDEDFYSVYSSSTDEGNVWIVTHSVGASTISVRVIGSSSADIHWKIKGVFQEDSQP